MWICLLYFAGSAASHIKPGKVSGSMNLLTTNNLQHLMNKKLNWIIGDINTRFSKYWNTCPTKFLYSSGVCVSHEDFEEFLTTNCVKYFDEAQQANYWMCCICNKTSRDKYDTKKHIESMHTNLPPLLCQICNKSYKTRESLRKHELEKHRS